MNLNVVTLARVFRELPEPQRTGQRHAYRFPARTVDLNRRNPRAVLEEPSDPAFRLLTFEAVQYAEGHRRWLEWELIA